MPEDVAEANAVDSPNLREGFRRTGPTVPPEGGLTKMAAWYNCDVIRAGPGGDNTIYIALRDKAGAFDVTWFIALPAQQKEMLATALTAIMTSLSVRASLDATVENTQINRLYIQTEVAP